MIYLTGDLHGEYDLPKLDEFYTDVGKNLTRQDYVIILGDFGMIFDADTNFGYLWEENRILEYFEEKYPWTTLFLDGNHENFIHLKQFPAKKWCGGKAAFLSDHCIWLKRGQVFTLQNKTFFIMGGACSIDKKWRQPLISWWAEEAITKENMAEARMNLLRHNNSVDYILTHCAPYPIYFDIARQEHFTLSDSEASKNELYLQEINANTKFTQWYFGHYHINRSFENGKYVCLYNDIIKLF